MSDERPLDLDAIEGRAREPNSGVTDLELALCAEVRRLRLALEQSRALFSETLATLEVGAKKDRERLDASLRAREEDWMRIRDLEVELAMFRGGA